MTLLKRRSIVKCKLWSINGWLRFTGFRVFISPATSEQEDTYLGVMWWGWPNDMGKVANE